MTSGRAPQAPSQFLLRADRPLVWAPPKIPRILSRAARRLCSLWNRRGQLGAAWMPGRCKERRLAMPSIRPSGSIWPAAGIAVGRCASCAGRLGNRRTFTTDVAADRCWLARGSGCCCCCWEGWGMGSGSGIEARRRRRPLCRPPPWLSRSRRHRRVPKCAAHDRPAPPQPPFPTPGAATTRSSM